MLLDRAHTDHGALDGPNPEMVDLPLSASPPPPSATSRSPAPDRSASTSETNTSDRSSPSVVPSSPSCTDLSQILLNIKSCRWRHFRPRTLPLHELDNAHPLFRRISRGVKRPFPASAGGQPTGPQRPARVVPAPAAGELLVCYWISPQRSESSSVAKFQPLRSPRCQLKLDLINKFMG